MIVSSTEIGPCALFCASLLAGCSSDASPACFGLEKGKTYTVSVRELLQQEVAPRPSCGAQFDLWLEDDLKFLVTGQEEGPSDDSCAENIASWENPTSVEISATRHRTNAASEWHVLKSFAEVTKGECMGYWTAQVSSATEGGDPFVTYTTGNPVVFLYRQFIARDPNTCPGMTFDSFDGCKDRFGVEMSAE